MNEDIDKNSSKGAETTIDPNIPYPVNINTAPSEELQLLPGIGEVIAGRIITFRDECGGFSDTEEIMNVSGIGEVLFEKIRDFICV